MWLSHSRWCALLHLWEKLIKPAILCLSRGKNVDEYWAIEPCLFLSPQRRDRGGHWHRIMYRVQLIHIHFTGSLFPRFHRPPENSTLAKHVAPRRPPNSQTTSVVWYQMGQWEGTFLIPLLSHHQQITFNDLTKNSVFTPMSFQLCFGDGKKWMKVRKLNLCVKCFLLWGFYS